MQRNSLTELLTQGCCEAPNTYDIYDVSNDTLIFSAVEVSDDCARCCCAPRHSMFVKFKPMVGQPGRLPRSELLQMPTVMTMEREGCSCATNKCCLGCCICCPYCADGFVLHAGDVTEPAGTTMLDGPNFIGMGSQPSPGGGGLTPTVCLMDRGIEPGSFRPLAKVEGPCLFGGCSELCLDSHYPVSTFGKGEFATRKKLGDLARITKRRPSNFGDVASQALGDADTFTMDFAPGSNLAPQQKATMMAALLLVDYMFFEKDNGMCDCNNQTIKITFCQSYCYGWQCNYNCYCRTPSVGGAAPTSDGPISR